VGPSILQFLNRKERKERKEDHLCVPHQGKYLCVLCGSKGRVGEVIADGFNP
jgi:hypothetical protein